MGNLFEKLKDLFSNSKLEVVLIGIENSGKTTLLNQLTMGEAQFTAPTIGLNVKSFKKGGVNLKVWDIGG
jgi:ADP-ribosylation factor-like protein 8